MTTYSYELDTKICAPGDFYKKYEAVWTVSDGVATTSASDTFGKIFTFTSRMMTLYNRDSPWNTPDSSPNTSPETSPTQARKREGKPKYKKVSKVPSGSTIKFQKYCLAEINDSQILYTCDWKEICGDANGFENFEINERNSAARDQLYEIKIHFDNPKDSEMASFLRFRVIYLDGKGRNFRGYAKRSDSDMGEREKWLLGDAIIARAFGDLEVDFKEWMIEEKKGESEEDFLVRARKHLKPPETPTPVFSGEGIVETKKKSKEKKKDDEKAFEETSDSE